MADLEQAISPPKNPHLIRRCILCDADDTEKIFTFTFDFLVHVRGMSPEWLSKIGWTPETTSSIVQCRNCRTKYVRDVFTNYEEAQEELTEANVQDALLSRNSNKLLLSAEKQIWILYNLLYHTHKQFDRDIALLDYGAGSGRWCNMARAMGVSRVFAYEPYNPYPPQFYSKFNFPGIQATRSWDEIASSGPFDAVICNAVFEHLSDPRENVQRILDHLNPGGFLYLHNPFMDLNNELNALKKAQKITKSMGISHYHPGHVNYLTPSEFRKFAESFNCKIIQISGSRLQIPLIQQVKSLLKSLLITTGLYHPKEILLQKRAH